MAHDDCVHMRLGQSVVTTRFQKSAEVKPVIHTLHFAVNVPKMLQQILRHGTINKLGQVLSDAVDSAEQVWFLAELRQFELNDKQLKKRRLHLNISTYP